jgi:dUTPase
MELQKVPFGVYGPIPAETVGKSGFTSGVQVFPGVVNEDYTGKIQVLMSVDGTTAFEKGNSVTQLLLLPYQPLNQKQQQCMRDLGGWVPNMPLGRTVSEYKQTHANY